VLTGLAKRLQPVQVQSTADNDLGAVDDSRLVFFGVCLCFLLSGFAALLYQTAWMRLFSVYFGTSVFAVATILATYMAGLAIGAAIAGKILHRVRRPILTYAFLEGLIAISALCVPVFMAGAGMLYEAMVGGQPEPPPAGGFAQPLFYLIASFFVLVIPTACMGATLPLLMRYTIHDQKQIGARTGCLYAINTFGAVLGTILAAFVFLPKLGLNGTVALGVLTNIAVFIIATIVSRKSNPGVLIANDQGPAKDLAKNNGRRRIEWILPIVALSGMVSFIYEVLWTRLLEHIIGGSVTAFATMLAAFLTGIAIGGALGGVLGRHKNGAVWSFVFAQFAIALCSAFAYLNLEGFIPAERNQISHAAMAILVMLPSTIFIGATFPLAVRIFADQAHDAGQKAAAIYSWNTLGAVVGAIAAAFIIIPALGFKGTIVLCVSANLTLGWLAMAGVLKRPLHLISLVMAWLAVVTFLAWKPGRPEAAVRYTAFEMNPSNELREEYYRVGWSSTVLVLSSFGNLQFRSNGLPEAGVLRKGRAPLTNSQQWLGAIPPLLRPEAENMMVVGYGGGVALEFVPDNITEIDVIELDPAVISANWETRKLRKVDPFLDKRINIVINDARNALRLTDKQYDIIVSQPSHPWTAGASHLFTKEYMALTKKRLKEDGILLQWMNAEFVTEDLLRDLVRTLLSEFKYAAVSQSSPKDMHIYASNAPLIREHDFQEMARVIDENSVKYTQIGINNILDIWASFILDEQGAAQFAGRGKLIRDNYNLLATNSRPLGDGLTFVELMKLVKPFDPLLSDNKLNLDSLSENEQLYIIRALRELGMKNRALDLGISLNSEPMKSVVMSTYLRHDRKERKARSLASRILRKFPDNDNAKFLSVYGDLQDEKFDFQNPENIEFIKGAGAHLQMIFNAANHAANDDWPAVIANDAELAKVSITDIYADYAFYLRARARVENKSATKEEFLQALLFTDKAIHLGSRLEYYELRADLATLLRDDGLFTGTLHYLARGYWTELVEKDQFGRFSSAEKKQVLADRIDRYMLSLGKIETPDEIERARELMPLFNRIIRKLAEGEP
jgi:spermidine synthase